MDKIEIHSVNSKQDLLNFIKFPWKIYSDDPNWVPPLISDQQRLFNQKENPFFNHSLIELFLAYKNREIVGRVAAILNNNHNKYHDTKIGFFGFFESVNNKNVINMLLTAVKDWLANKGCNQIMGPINFSINDQVGFLIDGFNSPPFIMLSYNPQYYHETIEDLGFKKAKDFFSYIVYERTFVNNVKVQRINQRLQKRYPVKTREPILDKFDSELELIRNIYNDSFANSWGFVPMNALEFKFKTDQLKEIVDPKLILIAEYDNDPAGFVLALPNFNEVLIKIRDGRLFPFGLFKIFRYRNKIRSVRIIAVCIRRKYKHLGLGSLFYDEITNRIFKQGYNHFEMSWVMEDNKVMNKIVNKLGGKKYKTYRVYQSYTAPQ